MPGASGTHQASPTPAFGHTDIHFLAVPFEQLLKQTFKALPCSPRMFLADLKRGGVDQETAQRVLKVWEETGATSPDQLRKLLLGRSLKTAGLVGLQTLLDAGSNCSLEPASPAYLPTMELHTSKSMIHLVFLVWGNAKAAWQGPASLPDISGGSTAESLMLR